MSLLDVWQSLDSTVQGIIIALGVVLLGTIKIKPLEINIWQWLAKTIGNALNKDLIKEVLAIKTELQILKDDFEKHEADYNKRAAVDARSHILRFAREILTGQCHTKEDFIAVLEYIDNYEAYCKKHPEFPNNRCLLAIDSIKNNYSERLEKGDFLAEEYRARIYSSVMQSE